MRVPAITLALYLLGCSTTVIEEIAAPDASPEPGFRDAPAQDAAKDAGADIGAAAPEASAGDDSGSAGQDGGQGADAAGCHRGCTWPSNGVCLGGGYATACGSRGAPCEDCVAVGLACVGDASSFACR